jgi:imidazole glycerol-phosphate synthase subunit HisH
MSRGIGNLLNVVRALTHAGAQVHVASSAAELPQIVERMVLPGVGAFAGGMTEMRQRGLDDVVKRFVATERPFLGICVGMQMLMDTSEEFGEHAGLGLIGGKVVAVPTNDAAGQAHRVPHIGWAKLLPNPANPRAWQNGPLCGTAVGERVYFVHSFQAVPAHAADALAFTDYGGQSICAAVAKNNVVGVQFHPERSAQAGLAMLRSFLAL